METFLFNFSTKICQFRTNSRHEPGHFHFRLVSKNRPKKKVKVTIPRTRVLPVTLLHRNVQKNGKEKELSLKTTILFIRRAMHLKHEELSYFSRLLFLFFILKEYYSFSEGAMLLWKKNKKQFRKSLLWRSIAYNYRLLLRSNL